MKNLFLSGLFAASLLILSSCLNGGGENTVSNYTIGVIKYDKSNRVVIEAPDFYPYSFYDPQLMYTFPGLDIENCVYFGYTVNLGAAENANVQTAGSYQGTVSSLSTVDTYRCSNYMIGDTSKLMDNEQSIAYAIDGNMGFSVISNILFLYSDLTMFTDQKNVWFLYFDAEAAPLKDTNSDQNVYSFFLRTVKTSEGKAPSQNLVVLNAFRMESYLERIQNLEKNAGNTKATIRFNYIKDIKEDKTFVWEKSDVSMDIPKE